MIARHSAPSRRLLCFVPDRGAVCPIPSALVPDPVYLCCAAPRHRAHGRETFPREKLG